MDRRTIRIGVDVGGTNTDICAIDEKSGELMVYKLPSSLHDQSAAVVEGVGDAVGDAARGVGDAIRDTGNARDDTPGGSGRTNTQR